MGAEEERQMIVAFGLEKTISKKKITSFSWRRLRGKGKTKYLHVGVLEKTWRCVGIISRCH